MTISSLWRLPCSTSKSWVLDVKTVKICLPDHKGGRHFGDHEAKIEKVTDHAEIMKYKILATPGLVINEKVVSAGRIPNESEITTFITSALEKD